VEREEGKLRASGERAREKQGEERREREEREAGEGLDVVGEEARGALARVAERVDRGAVGEEKRVERLVVDDEVRPEAGGLAVGAGEHVGGKGEGALDRRERDAAARVVDGEGGRVRPIATAGGAEKGRVGIAARD